MVDILNLILSKIEESIVGALGGHELFAIAICVLFLVSLIATGNDFRYSIMIIMPLIPAFAQSGWFPIWVEGLFWIVIVGFGIYFVYGIIRREGGN